MSSASANAPSTANARLAAAGLTATTILLLTAGLSMLQPLSTDLYLSTLPGIATYFNASVASVQSTLWMFIAVFGIWQLIAGPLSDRFGRYPIVVAGAFTYCAGCWRRSRHRSRYSSSVACCRRWEHVRAWSVHADLYATCTHRPRARG